MRCKDCKRLLSQFLDGQLDSRRQKMMQEHLAGCSECGRALASITEMVKVMRSIQDAEPPEDFLQKVNARIDGTAWWQVVLERLAGLCSQRLPMQAAAVLAVLVLAVHVSNRIKPPLSLREEMKSPVIKQELPVKEEETPGIADEQLCIGNKPAEKDTAYYHSGEAEEMTADSGELRCNNEICKMSAARQEQILPENMPRNASSSVVVELKEGNFIAANRRQRWMLSCFPDGRITQEEVLSVLEGMRISGIEREKINESGAFFCFTVAFRQVPILLSRLEKIGKVTLAAPLPLVRPEAYGAARGGGINPKVLEESIHVELTLEKSP